MSSLIAYKDTGEPLFDTNLICYGLIKSGYMTLQQYWTRRQLLSAQLDPTEGSNWTTSVASSSYNAADGLWGFTVFNAISPIVFITGSGCLNGTIVNGNATTFLYSSASVNTKFYCFDLMADNLPGTTFLKTWTDQGRITFNSLQPPLNVIAAIQAPGPGAVDQYGRYLTTYAGGANRVRQALSTATGLLEVGQSDSYVDIGLAAEEYAAYLPWSRSCTMLDLYSGGSSRFRVYAGIEGAYGYAGGITFMFGASAATTESAPTNQGYTVPISFTQMPVDRFPVALVIRTSNLIFPYN